MDTPHSTQDPLALETAVRDDLVVARREFGGQAYVVIEDPLREKFFRLGTAEYAFVQLLDGSRTVAEAVGLAASQLGEQAFTRDEALRLIAWLAEARLLKNDLLALQTSSAPSAPRSRFSFMKLLAWKISLGNPDRWLDALSPVARRLFSPMALGVWCCLWVVALWAAFQGDMDLLAGVPDVLRPNNWIALLAIWLVLKFIHELGHGLACKAFGVPVRDAGISLLLFAPVAYVDVTPVWRLESRWQRIAVSAAGVYLEGFVAAISLWYWASTTPSTLADVAREAFLMASLHTLLVNANPLVRFDGYYVLADLWDLPNLHSVARQWLDAALKKLLGDNDQKPPALTGTLRYLVPAYALGAIVWRTLLYVSIALLLYSWHESLGTVLTGALIAAWLSIPCIQCGAFVVALVRTTRASNYRLATLGMVSIGAIMTTCWSLAQDATLQAPGVVEYAPLTIVRVGNAGFVREVLVEDGQAVQAGQILMKLANDDLMLEAEDLRCRIRISQVLAQSLASRQELGERASEEAKRTALEQRLQELETQVEALTVRAPCAGRILSRGLSSLVGCHLTIGTEIGVIGSEDAKEVIIAVEQQDIDAWPTDSGAPVRLRLDNAGDLASGGSWNRIEPAAQLELPHGALSAARGGPVAVQLRSASATNQDLQHRPLHPLFKATVRLDEETSRNLQAGRLISVQYVTHRRSRASCLLHHIVRMITDAGSAPKPG